MPVLGALPVLYASLTGPLVNLATSVIGSLGLWGVFLLTATTGVIGVPGTEPTMLFAGFNVYQGNLTMFGVIVAGVLGDTLGASIAYGIGNWGTHELTEHPGARLHVNPRRLARAHRWFERYGAPVIFFSRLIPFARAAFPYAAGIAKMPFGRFVALAAAGSVVWVSGLAVLGREVGSNWQSWRHHLEYADYTVIALVAVGVAYLAVRRLRRSRRANSETSRLPDTGGGEPERTPVDVVSK